MVRPPATLFHQALASEYWHPHRLNQWLELAAAIILLPVSLPAAIVFYAARNALTIRRREGLGISGQIRGQIEAYFSAGVLPPWYYAFELYRNAGRNRGKAFLHRFETHGGVYELIKIGSRSPLNNKDDFAEHCASNGIPHVQHFLRLDGDRAKTPVLPHRDLFVKPVVGRGGKGAERWDFVAPSFFRQPNGNRLSGEDLLTRLCRRARERPLLIQPRLIPHRALSELSNGALCTVRVLTCTNEVGRPEVIEAVFRTAIGDNRTVDNMHAGGIAAEVAIRSGRLGRASNLGFDARLGWISCHPDTGARIEGTRLPLWNEVKDLAVRAHQAFGDRVLIGWDIAILDEGPVIVEGNSSPDLDLHQRPAQRGLVESRAGRLMSMHLAERLQLAIRSGNDCQPYRKLR